MDHFIFDKQHAHAGAWGVKEAPYVFVAKEYVKSDIIKALGLNSKF